MRCRAFGCLLDEASSESDHPPVRTISMVEVLVQVVKTDAVADPSRSTF